MNTTEDDLGTLDAWCEDFLESTKGVNFFNKPAANHSAIVFGCVITVVSIVNNVIVFLSLTLRRSRPSVSSNTLTLTLSLVCTDLLLSVVGMPVAIYNLVLDVPGLGRVGCRIFNTVDILLCTVSILHLVGLALDRYLAICYPFRYHSLGVTSARIACVIAWVLAGIISLPMFISAWQKIRTADSLVWRCLLRFSQSDHTCYFLADPLLQTVSVTLCFFLPLVIIIVLHVRIYLAARAHAKVLKSHGRLLSMIRPRSFNREGDQTADDAASRHDERQIISDIRTELEGIVPDSASTVQLELHETGNGQANESPERRQTKSQDKAIKAVVCLVLGFVVCWLPLFASVMLDTLTGYRVPFYVLTIFTLLGYLNSAINPLLYYRYNVTVRRAIRSFLGLRSSEDDRP